jgi:uncharacterized membrane protein
MTRLVLGLLLWSVVHFIPGMAVDFRKNLIDRFGKNPYKGIFALLMFVALYLVISGWQSMTPVAPDVLETIFTPPEWGVYAAGLLVLIGFILFLAPYPPNNLKRIMRHPQLIGVVSFSVGHLFAVGTARAIILFAGLTIWAVIEIVLINRRDGEWVKPATAPIKKDVALVVFSVLVYLAFLYTHHLMFGGSPLTQ